MVRHSKDRLFITATEWSEQYGGKKNIKSTSYRPLPFDHCGLTLVPFITPVCLHEGVIFELEALMEYILKYKKNPITGDPVTSKDIIRLNIDKNADGEWQCPVLNKALTNNTHVVAIKTTGNVYCYDAVNELNIKPKNYTDLITGESFKKSDIITLQDPRDPEHMKLRDVNNFIHLNEVRDEHQNNKSIESKIKLNSTGENIMKELEKSNDIITSKKRKLDEIITKLHEDSSYIDDVKDILDLKPLIEDVNPGQKNTDGRASSSFTSSVITSYTSNASRLATADDIRDALYKKMRQLGKKGYVQIQTNIGNLNIEIHCDIAPKTSYNFISLCNNNYYQSTIFHRLIKGFMLQGGDPTGTGTGGESVWKGKFKDEFDTRILHSDRGVVSMANSGCNTNGSQFFITLKDTKHLDLVHSVFGKVVGGSSTLDRVELIDTDKHDRPIKDIKIINTVVFTNPINEAKENLIEFIKINITTRVNNGRTSALPSKVK
mmetsp:Transcript_17510/g.15787  ORF Transcript_17510/g.15787 Transcript_17510/m.15787 type:complete len:490 (+) Transcript_17510:28-1497(+)